MIRSLCAKPRTGVEGVQVLSAVWASQGQPSYCSACGLTAARPLEGPLGNDSTGRFFLGLAGMFAQPCLRPACTVPRNVRRLPISHILLVTMAV